MPTEGKRRWSAYGPRFPPRNCGFFVTTLAPISRESRNLTGWDFFLLWSGAAISLSEIWAGGLLLPLGFVGGLIAILLGHIIGNTPMATSGLIGSRHGVPAIVSTRGALGNRGSFLPAVLNVIQLVGWTAVMLWIGGRAAADLLPLSILGDRGWIALLGILTTLWALAGHRLWKWIQRAAVLFLLALSVLLTSTTLGEYGLRGLVQIQPTGEMPFMLGLDLVIAMPISWVPLVSDYSRYAVNDRAAFRGTWWGYLIASSWMYLVGLCAALATGSSSPETMVLGLMQNRDLLLAGLLIVLFSTFTTTFLDIYSNAISLQSMMPRVRERLLVALSGLLGTILAIFFPAAEYEDFLLLIGSAFCPLFGVVLTDYLVLKRGGYDPADLFRKGRYWYTGGVHLWALPAWLIGFVTYRACAAASWVGGSSLPGMVVAGLVYFLTMRLVPEGTREGTRHEHV